MAAVLALAVPGAALLAALAPGAYAATWRGVRGVDATLTLSDNIDQNSTEDAGLEGTVSPHMAVNGIGGRAVVAASYRLNAIGALGGNDATQIAHQFEGLADLQIKPDVFAVGARASVRQEAVGRADRATGQRGFQNGLEVTDVITVSVNPRLTQRLGNIATATGSYEIAGVLNVDADDGNSLSHELRGELASGSRFNTFRWTGGYSINHEDNEDEDSTFARVRTDLRVNVFKRISLIGGVGLEHNSGRSDAEDDLNGLTARAGIGYNPSRRTSFQAGVDYRAFGSSPFLELSHRARRLTATANVRQTLTSSSRLQSERDLENIRRDAESGAPVVTENTSGELTTPTDTPRIGSELIEQRSAGFTLSYARPITSAGITARFIEREFLESDDDETVLSLSLTGGQRLSRLATLTANVGLQRTERQFGDGSNDENSDRLSLGIGLERTFATNLTGRVGVNHVRLNSTDSDDSYDETRLSVGLNYLF